MQPVEFPQQNEVLAKNQPQYTPLPVFIKFETVQTADGPKEVPMEMTACLQLSPEEIAEINATSKLWHTQCVFGNPFQPIRLSTQNPFEVAPQPQISPIHALVKALTADPAYRETWKANLAMAYQDEYLRLMPETVQVRKEILHTVANQAAEKFLNLLCSQGN
jgi:hypothetical protein